MSLVAYGASDESDNSDTEEREGSNSSKNEDTVPDDSAGAAHISDDDDYTPTERTSHPATTRDGADSRELSAPSALSDLPAPKSTESALALVQEDELEDEVKPKFSQLADAPKPPASHKAKQTTRIVLPALQQDSDDEDDSSKKSKQGSARTGKGSGLFSLLPPPVHGTKKQMSRPLIPYTLTKRPANSAVANKTSAGSVSSSQDTGNDDFLPSQKHKSAFNALTGYESDSDEDDSVPSRGVSFFSWGSEAEAVSSSSGLSVVKNSAPTMDNDDQAASEVCSRQVGVKSELGSAGNSDSPSDSKSVSSTTAAKRQPSVSTSAVTSTDVSLPTSTTGDNADDDGNINEDSEGEEGAHIAGVPEVNQDAPLNFRSSLQRGGWSFAPLVAPTMPEMYAVHSTGSMAASASHWQTQEHFAQDMYPTNQGEDSSGDYNTAASGSGDIQQYMADEQFLRLAPGSGKRKRSGEEIEIIDANVDDYVDPGELMKGISEESAYQPHRKKDNLPSSQQRRKKQITYLAFQAKERELELKNQWSQNRMTKNVARSKYGF